MNKLRNDIIVYITTFLQYNSSFGSNGIITLNKCINSVLKNTPICIKRKIKIQNLIIKSCLYHNIRSYNFTKNEWLVKLLYTAKEKKKNLENILEINKKLNIN